jgi:hypothetical protein
MQVVMETGQTGQERKQKTNPAVVLKVRPGIPGGIP